MEILIVRISSLGDIIQAFSALELLHAHFPASPIDWVVETSLAPVVSAHPFVRRAIPISLREWRKQGLSISAWKKGAAEIAALRQTRYDLLFDLQGNMKSGLLTFLARAKKKIGFGIGTAREWPNVLATDVRFEVSKKMNICLHYRKLVEEYLRIASGSETSGVSFKLTPEEKKPLDRLLQKTPSRRKMMVCPGSKWPNKQLPEAALADFLQRISQAHDPVFLFVWGNEAEKGYCQTVAASLQNNSLLVDKLSLPAWQNLMGSVDLILAVDSSALHLAGTTSTPTFSVFGPTAASIFKPLGQRHGAIQGTCPYKQTFEKTCPALRTCPTGACIRHLTGADLFAAFNAWWLSVI